MQASTPVFLDVPELLERSRPTPRVPWFWYIAGSFVLFEMLAAYVGGQSPLLQQVMQLFSALAVMLLMGSIMAGGWLATRAQRAEQEQLEAAGELVQLRRWPEAAALLQQMLSRPLRSVPVRLQSLIYLTSVLARYDRFADAIAVQDHLLEQGVLDEQSEYALRAGRAMAMLREDHLFDADRAISELRRVPQGGGAAALALVQIYRDVKTGHPAEALEIFQQKLPALREQLGHRLADVYVLVAKAHDFLNEPAEAQRAYEQATRLAPAAELHRRYPETAELAQRYTPATPPAEAA